MNEIFKNGKKITTISFDGWQLPEEERKLLVDFAKSDEGIDNYTSVFYDVGTTIFVDTALEYGLDDETIEENPDKPLLRVREILQAANDEGIDKIML